MRALVASILLVATCIVVSSTVGADAPADRPSGVAASDWVPISSSLGLVLVHPPRAGDSTNDCACYKKGLCGSCAPVSVGPSDTTTLLLAPPTEGYLMVKRGTAWVRLVIVDPLRGPGASG